MPRRHPRASAAHASQFRPTRRDRNRWRGGHDGLSCAYAGDYAHARSHTELRTRGRLVSRPVTDWPTSRVGCCRTVRVAPTAALPTLWRSCRAPCSLSMHTAQVAGARSGLGGRRLRAGRECSRRRRNLPRDVSTNPKSGNLASRVWRRWRSTDHGMRSQEFDLTVKQGVLVGQHMRGTRSKSGTSRNFFRPIVNDDPMWLIHVERVDPSAAWWHCPRACPDTQPRHRDRPRGLRIGRGSRDEGDCRLPSTRSTHCARIDDVNLPRLPRLSYRHPGGDDQQRAAEDDRALRELGDRFAILDSEPGTRCSTRLPPRASRPSGRVSTRSAVMAPCTSLAACAPRGQGEPILVPPSGHVVRHHRALGQHARRAQGAGERARERRDGRRAHMSDVDQGQLNMRGINVLPRASPTADA
jgi:hypothetical protein